MRKIILLLAVCASMTASLAGCVRDSAELNNSINIVTVEAKELQTPVYGERDSAASAVAYGANDFAFKLSAALVKNVNDESFVCSPYSVWLPLAALVNAANYFSFLYNERSH